MAIVGGGSLCSASSVDERGCAAGELGPGAQRARSGAFASARGQTVPASVGVVGGVLRSGAGSALIARRTLENQVAGRVLEHPPGLSTEELPFDATVHRSSLRPVGPCSFARGCFGA